MSLTFRFAKKLFTAVNYLGGTRNRLETYHALRYLGQSQKCCPSEYYKNVKVVTDSYLLCENDETEESMVMCKYITKDKCNNRDFRVCDYKNIDGIRAFLKNDNAKHIWYHENTPYKVSYFVSDLYYHHADYR
jgi:hypothetical protein